MVSVGGRLRTWLAAAPAPILTLFAIATSFSTVGRQTRDSGLSQSPGSNSGSV